MKNALVILTGISVGPYGVETLNKESALLNYFNNNYDLIQELDYNKHLDSYTIQTKFNLKYLDPVRLRLNPFRRHKIIKEIELAVRELQLQGYNVDFLCHSQGCWVAAMTELNVRNCIFTGSPIGFQNPVGRFIVRANIAPWPWSKPSFRCERFLNLYSTYDFVGRVPSLISKWFFGASSTKEIDCMNSHSFDEYLHFIVRNNLLKFI